MHAAAYLLLAVMVVALVTGRFYTFHLTEGEALIAGGWFWLTSGLAGVLVLLLSTQEW